MDPCTIGPIGAGNDCPAVVLSNLPGETSHVYCDREPKIKEESRELRHWDPKYCPCALGVSQPRLSSGWAVGGGTKFVYGKGVGGGLLLKGGVRPGRTQGGGVRGGTDLNKKPGGVWGSPGGGGGRGRG